MAEYTKLLKMVIEELDKAPPDPESQGQAAIHAIVNELEAVGLYDND